MVRECVLSNRAGSKVEIAMHSHSLAEAHCGSSRVSESLHSVARTTYYEGRTEDESAEQGRSGFTDQDCWKAARRRVGAFTVERH